MTKTKKKKELETKCKPNGVNQRTEICSMTLGDMLPKLEAALLSNAALDVRGNLHNLAIFSRCTFLKAASSKFLICVISTIEVQYCSIHT